MPEKKIYKRMRDGLIFADVGKVHNDMFLRMVEDDHSDKTKTLRWLIEQEWARRGMPRLVAVIGEETEGVENVPVYEASR